MVKIEFTPLSLDRKIFPFKKGFKKDLSDHKRMTDNHLKHHDVVELSLTGPLPVEDDSLGLCLYCLERVTFRI